MHAPNTFTGGRLDRAAEHRADPAWLAAQATHPAARAVLVDDDGVHVGREDPPRLARVRLETVAGVVAPIGPAPPAAAPPGPDGPATAPLLLGLDAAGPVFAVDLGPPRAPNGRPPLVGAHGEGPARPGTGTRALGLRRAATSLPHADAALAAHAAALVNWHRRHPRCAVCGQATSVMGGGIARRCPRCGTEHHPRTDPVAIMVVIDGPERVLLGRQASWPAGRYSALAGFVEPGESLEEAVVREVREEAGVQVGDPAYVSSQPWPFPSSLMVGYTVPYRSGTPRRVDGELEDLRWFSRAEVRAAADAAGDDWEAPPAAGRALALPPPYAIARRLLEHWLASP